MLHQLSHPRRRHVAAAVMAGLAGSGLVGCSGGPVAPPPAPSALVVAPGGGVAAQVRVSFAPQATAEEAKRVQDRLGEERGVVRSVLHLPARALDVAVTLDPAVAVDLLRARLEGQRPVAGVEACPCPPPPPDPAMADYGLHPARRTCARAGASRAVAGCVDEHVLVQARPGNSRPGNVPVLYRVLRFDATASAPAGHRVGRLKARVAIAGTSRHVFISPAGYRVLRWPDPSLALDDFGFSGLAEQVELAPGRLLPYAFNPNLYHVSLFPDRTVGEARVKAQMLVSVPVAEEFSYEYRIGVAYR